MLTNSRSSFTFAELLNRTGIAFDLADSTENVNNVIIDFYPIENAIIAARDF